jgi:hypothetical protein
MRLLPLLATFGALAALSAPPAVAAPARHAAAKPAAAPAGAPAVPTAIPGFDARDPDSIIAMLKQMNAEGKIVKTGGDVVVIGVTAPNLSFGIQMMGCDAKAKACHALVMSASSEKPATLAQINVFNRSQPMCRGLLNTEGKISVSYFALVGPHTALDEARQQMAVWGGCLSNFGEFLKDPAAFPPKAAPKPPAN